ncbi:glycosyltransferase [bacterium]|nr:glycosyltransferase [bacterium]
MSEPKISVVMPVYNREQYLKESVESILNQTFTDFEFIIVDDQSTDSSWKIIQEYASKDSRIVAVKNTGKKGCYPARNCGHKLAKGKYIAVMDSDDISLPERLKTQFNFMEQNPEIGICGSWAKTFGDENNELKPPQNHERIRDANFFFCSMVHPTIMFRNKDEIVYSEEALFSQDYELFCRKINDLKFANIPKILLLYRVHKNQIGNAKKAEQDHNANTIKLRNLETIGITLSEEEKQIYLEIINKKFTPQNKDELLLAVKMLNSISINGAQHGYKQYFQDTVQRFIINSVKNSSTDASTFFKLYFTLFRKLKSFESIKAKLRYFYHGLRFLFHV